jgi:hypothetical protein
VIRKMGRIGSASLFKGVFCVIERFALYLIDSLGIRSALGIFFSPDDGHAHLWCLRHIKANLKKAGFTKFF